MTMHLKISSHLRIKNDRVLSYRNHPWDLFWILTRALLVLVISQTLKHGYTEGVKVAFAPIITDLPIILITVLFVSLISEYSSILGVISILGGIYIGYMAHKSFKTRGLSENIEFEPPNSLKKGATVNFLNPISLFVLDNYWRATINSSQCRKSIIGYYVYYWFLWTSNRLQNISGLCRR